MHALQSFPGDPCYNGKADTVIRNFSGGFFTLFAQHLTEPISPSDRPEYHMTYSRAWCMTGSLDPFRDGVTAYRNASD